MYIDIDDYRYSLCVNYPGKSGQLLLYRVADFNPETKEFFIANYNKKHENDYSNPTVIGADPIKLEKNKIEIRRWKPKEGFENQQWSYEYYDKIHEVVFCDDFFKDTNITDIEIRNILSKGIKIPEYIKDNFLLPIREESDSYEMIYCCVKDFIQVNGIYCIEQKVTDMFHTVHTFKKYKIEKNKILDTKQLKNIFDIRYYYSDIELPNKFDEISIRNADAYIHPFLKKYLTFEKERLGVTKKDINNIISIIDGAMNYGNEISYFFENTKVDIGEFKYRLEENKKQVISFIEKSDQFTSLIERIFLNDLDGYEKLLEVVKNRWMNESSEIRDKIEEQLSELRLKIINENNVLEEIINEQNKVKNNIYKMNQRLEQQTFKYEENKSIYEIEYENILKRKQDIELDIKERLLHFKDNLVKSTEMLCLAEMVLGNDGAKNLEKRELFGVIEPHEILEDTALSEDINDINDFHDDLSDNLSIYFDEQVDIAAVIISSLINKKAIILENSIIKNVSLCVSALIDQKTPLILDIDSKDTKASDVIGVIQESNSKTIVITGVLDNYNEALFSSICRMNKDKFIFFGISEIKSIKLMSNDIIKQSIILDIESQLKLPAAESILISNVDLNAFSNEFDITECKEYYDYNFKPLFINKIMSKKVAIDFSAIINIYYEIISGKKPLSIMNNVILQSCDLDNIEEKKLKSILTKCGLDICKVGK